MFKKIKSFLFKNTSAKQTVAKNTIWLTISNFGGRLLKATVIIYAARILGTAGYGLFSYAVTLAGFFTLFVDPGINGIVMRDGGKGSEQERLKIFSTTLVMKACLITIGVLATIFLAPSFSTLPGAIALIPVVALIVFFDSTREFLSSLIRSMEKMEWETGIFIFTNFAVVVFGFLFLHFSPSALSFGWAYVAGTAMGALAALFTLRSYLKNFLSHFSRELVIPIIRSAWPFAVTGALGSLLTSADILIISWMRSASDVGIYSAAVRIIQVLYLIPMIFQFSSIPILARLARDNSAKFREALERTIEIILLVSIPLALGGVIVGTQFMTLLFGAAYSAGGLSLKILMLTLLFDFPAAIISSAIFVYDHQKSLIICSAIGAVLNVVLDLVFIPHWGIAGSAAATLIAQIASNWYLWRTMKKINYFEVLPHLQKIFVAGLVMAVTTFILFIAGVHVAVNVIISAIVYGGMLWFLHEPLIGEVRKIIFPREKEPIKSSV